MTFDPQPLSGTGTGAILRALGSLMAALGGEDTSIVGRALASRREAAYPPAYVTPEAPSMAYDPGRTTSTAVAVLLGEARERAERILQDATQRANQLLARERATPAGETSEPIRRSVDELLLNMRDVQARLARIEAILANRPAAATAAAPAAPIAPQRPAAFAPVEEDRRSAIMGAAAPQPLRPTASPPPPAPITSPLPPLPSSAPLTSVPPSAVPPMRGGAQPAAQAASAAMPQRNDDPVPATSTWQRDEPDDEVGSTLATFTLADGSVQLRAAPVSGFQGLMRLQDALQRIPAVRQATVEAYSQGEARLRLEIGSDIDSDQIAEHLSVGIGQSAQVREASEADRTIVIAFE